LRAALRALIEDYRTQLQNAPAAWKKHQAYLGGLLEHILSLCGLAVAVSARYFPQLNRDVLIAACIVHDIGKVEELAYEDFIGYSRQGSLLGHIVQGSIIWSLYADRLDPATRDHIAHIIVSHHGRRDWGSPQVPMTREAQIFHLLDMIDSRMGLLDNIFAAGVDANGFTQYDRGMETQLWDGK
jgi:3'-5' exoribonuclease